LRSKKIKSQNRKHGKHVQAKSAECKMIAEIGGKKKPGKTTATTWPTCNRCTYVGVCMGCHGAYRIIALSKSVKIFQTGNLCNE